MNKITTTTYESNPFKSTFRGFGNFFTYNQNIAIILLVLANVGTVFQLFDMGGSSNSTTTSSNSSSTPVAAVILIILLVAAFTVASFLLGCLINGMITFAALKTSKKETTTIKEAFRETKARFWSLVYAQVVATLKIIGGTLLFIIPGIRAALRYTMVMFPIFDEDLSGKEALQRMKFLTKDHLLEMFGIMTVAGIIPFVGALLQWGGVSVMYPQLKALKNSNAPKPPVHWLNYIGFIFVAFWILLVAFIIVLIAALSNVR